MNKSKIILIFLIPLLLVSIYMILPYFINLSFQEKSKVIFSPPLEGSKLAEITFINRENKEFTFSDFSGKILLVNFWATWCLPCRVEMPSLDRLQSDIGDEEFQVIIVAVERTSFDKIDNFVNSINVKYLESFHDPKTISGFLLKAKGLPTTLLLDRNGNEIGRVEGPLEWDSQSVKNTITKLKNVDD